MPFSEPIKKKVRRQAWYACCICKKISMGLEIHHIVPQATGGPDREENAAPLCASCHTSFGGNPDHRARIKEMRDHWYESCKTLFRENSDPDDVFRAIHDSFSVEELKRWTVHNPGYVLGDSTDGRLKTTRFSFCNEEYVHPRIVQELIGEISDIGATVVGVNLETANRSNRFYGDFTVEENPKMIRISWEEAPSAFVYRHVATTPSGVEIVECHDRLGGSGVFGMVALFTLDCDRELHKEGEAYVFRERTVLKLLGQFALGDRYQGSILYSNGVLTVGPDHGWFNRGEEAAWRLPVL